MKRVAILGAGGSGKSHVARELGRILNIPVTHLDAVYFDDGWSPLPMEDFAAAQRTLVAQPQWIIDGNYNTTLPIRLAAADTVVLMDVPTLAALRGIIWRQLRHGAGHKGNGIHNRITWDVITYVATYRRRMRPRVLAKIALFAPHANVALLANRRQTRHWLKRVRAERGLPSRDRRAH